MSPRKARLVTEHVRGRTVPEARTVLAFTPRAAAREIEKVLGSAVANAESAHALDGDELFIEAAFADEGPTLKRWRPRARGRVNRIRKRTCHITVVLAPAEGAIARRQVEKQEARGRRGLPRRRAAEAPAVVEAEGPEEIEELVEEPQSEAAVEVETPEAVETTETVEEPGAEEAAQPPVRESGPVEAPTAEPVAEPEPEAAEPEPEEKPKRRRA